MATVNEALNDLSALVYSGTPVGNGECYALASYYESLINPDGTVGLGAGVGYVSGAIGDTICAANIGTSYDWSANGWSVSSDDKLQPGQILTIQANAYNEYGHVVVVEAVDGDQLTVIEQNYAGARYPVRNYYSASDYQQTVAHYITPPGAETTENESNTNTSTEPNNYKEDGTMTVTVDAINVRRAPDTSGEVVAQYTKGKSFKYDTVIIDYNGFVWVSYIGSSGNRNYVATGPTQNGKRFGDAWGTFK